MNTYNTAKPHESLDINKSTHIIPMAHLIFPLIFLGVFCCGTQALKIWFWSSLRGFDGTKTWFILSKRWGSRALPWDVPRFLTNMKPSIFVNINGTFKGCVWHIISDLICAWYVNIYIMYICEIFDIQTVNVMGPIMGTYSDIRRTSPIRDVWMMT